MSGYDWEYENSIHTPSLGRCTQLHPQRGMCVLERGHQDTYPYEDHVYPSSLDQRLHDIGRPLD